MGEILQVFSILFLIVSGLGMSLLIFYSLTNKMLTKDIHVVIAVIVGGIVIAFTLLFFSSVLTDFSKLTLLKSVCRVFGMTTIVISLLSVIAITIIAKDKEPAAMNEDEDEKPKSVVKLLIPASILYVFIGFFFIWYGESLSHPQVLFWFMANGISFVVTAIVALIAIMYDAFNPDIDFNQKYLWYSIGLSISLGIFLFVLYSSNVNDDADTATELLSGIYHGFFTFFDRYFITFGRG